MLRCNQLSSYKVHLGGVAGVGSNSNHQNKNLFGCKAGARNFNTAHKAAVKSVGLLSDKKGLAWATATSAAPFSIQYLFIQLSDAVQPELLTLSFNRLRIYKQSFIRNDAIYCKLSPYTYCALSPYLYVNVTIAFSYLLS